MSEDNVPSTWEDVFRHKRFKELLDRANAAEAKLETANTELETLKAQLPDLQAKLQQAQAGQTELEKLQTSLADLTQKFEQSQQQLTQQQRANLRMKVATELGLPAAFADRLKGEDEAAIRADAEHLLEYAKPTSPGTPPSGPRKPPPPAFTEAQLSDPAFIRENRHKIMAEAAKE